MNNDRIIVLLINHQDPNPLYNKYNTIMCWAPIGVMIQVLSLMATHSNEISQCSRSTTKNYKLDSKE